MSIYLLSLHGWSSRFGVARWAAVSVMPVFLGWIFLEAVIHGDPVSLSVILGFMAAGMAVVATDALASKGLLDQGRVDAGWDRAEQRYSPAGYARRIREMHRRTFPLAACQRQAQIDGLLRLQDNAVAFIGRFADEIRAVTLRLLEPAMSYDRTRLITKRDLKGTDKRFPAVLPGSKRHVWVVEGGVDALAVADWHSHYHPDQAGPTVIASGGAGVRGFLDMPHVQEVLRQAENVIITKDREKSLEVQSRTDADHEKQIMKIREIVGASVAVTEWVPPQGCKDVAEAWQQRVLPDPEKGSGSGNPLDSLVGSIVDGPRDNRPTGDVSPFG